MQHRSSLTMMILYAIALTLAGLSLGNLGPAVVSAQGGLLSGSSISSSGSGSGQGVLHGSNTSSGGEEVGALCASYELEVLARNPSCYQAPLYMPLNETEMWLACQSEDCTNFIEQVKMLDLGDCRLYNSTYLYTDYIAPLEAYCASNFTNGTWTGNGNYTLAANGTLIYSNASDSGSFEGGGSTWGNTIVSPIYNTVSRQTIITIVLGSVFGGVMVTVLLVWMRSYRRKQKARKQFAADFGFGGGPGPGGYPVGKFGAAPPLTPSTNDGSGVHYSSAGDTGEPDVVISPLPAATADAFVAMTTMQLNLSTNSSSSGFWEDDAIIAARIPREKIKSEVLLSRGGFGEVYRGTFNGQVVAIKSLLPEKRKNLRQINAFLAEVKLMAFLEHAQIVTFVGVAWDSLTDLCVVTEYMEGGDLRALLEKFEGVEKRPHGFDTDKVRIALHIAHAMTYLHSLHPIVLHRDLKSKNILLDGKLNAKLTDFGVSRERGDGTMTAGVGTSLWMAPEIMMGERYDHRADMFSFGIVLSELDSHALPYSQVKVSDSGRRLPVLQLVSLGRLKVQFSENAPKALVELGNACISLDPYERPTAAEAMCKLHKALKALKNSSPQ